MKNLVKCVAAASLYMVTTNANALFVNPQRVDCHVTIVNDSNNDIISFYASNAGRDKWEDDILGRSTLDAGYQIRLNIDDHSGRCRFDFKAVFGDGTEIIRWDVNVCEISRFTYY